MARYKESGTMYCSFDLAQNINLADENKVKALISKINKKTIKEAAKELGFLHEIQLIYFLGSLKRKGIIKDVNFVGVVDDEKKA